MWNAESSEVLMVTQILTRKYNTLEFRQTSRILDVECTPEVEDGGSVRDVNRDSAFAQSRSDNLRHRSEQRRRSLWLQKGMGKTAWHLTGGWVTDRGQNWFLKIHIVAKSLKFWPSFELDRIPFGKFDVGLFCGGPEAAVGRGEPPAS